MIYSKVVLDDVNLVQEEVKVKFFALTWNWVSAGNSNERPRNVRVKTCLSLSYTPGCVAPKDWSICSMVGETSDELNIASLKRKKNRQNEKKNLHFGIFVRKQSFTIFFMKKIVKMQGVLHCVAWMYTIFHEFFGTCICLNKSGLFLTGFFFYEFAHENDVIDDPDLHLDSPVFEL